MAIRIGVSSAGSTQVVAVITIAATMHNKPIEPRHPLVEPISYCLLVSLMGGLLDRLV
jgi:hypothetical protein